MNNKQKSIIAMLISTFGFSVMGVFIKLTSEIPIIQRVTIRSYIIVLTSFLVMTYYKVPFKGIKHYKLLTLRALLGTFGIILNYYAADHLLLSDANMLFRLSTFFLLLFSWIFLREKLSFEQFLAIAIAFIGMLFIIKPQMNIDVIPYMIAILGAAVSAGAYTVVRVLGPKEQPLVVVMYFAVFTAIVLTPIALINYVPMEALKLLYVCLAGVGAAVGQVGVTYAYKHAPAKEVSIYGYFGIIFSAIFSIIVFGTSPDIFSIIGYVIIFITSYYMYRLDQGKKIRDKKVT